MELQIASAHFHAHDIHSGIHSETIAKQL